MERLQYKKYIMAVDFSGTRYPQKWFIVLKAETNYHYMTNNNI